MRLSKRVVTFLSILLVVCMVALPVSATNTSISDAQKRAFEKKQIEELQSGRIEMLQDGETREVYRDEGGVMYVTVEDTSPNIATYGYNTTASRTFTFRYETVTGSVVDAFRVYSSCTWYNDGANSYIVSFSPSAVSLHSSFSVVWENRTYDTPISSQRYLNVYRGGVGSAYYIFYADILRVANPVSCYLGYNVF